MSGNIPLECRTGQTVVHLLLLLLLSVSNEAFTFTLNIPSLSLSLFSSLHSDAICPQHCHHHHCSNSTESRSVCTGVTSKRLGREDAVACCFAHTRTVHSIKACILCRRQYIKFYYLPVWPASLPAI